MNNEFERWISLGNFCLTKFQINRHILYHHFGLTENLAAHADAYIATIKEYVPHINGGNYFFDWVVVHDFTKLIESFNNGFNYRLNRLALSEVQDEDGRISSIACRKLGLYWHHLFPRDGDHVVWDWKQHFPEASAKVDHLRAKFMSLKDHRTLYIAAMSPEEIKRGIPEQLHAALQALRNNDNFVLLAVAPWSTADEEILQSDREGLYIRHYDPALDIPSEPWYGNSAAWDRMLSQFQLSLPTISLPAPPIGKLRSDILPHFEGHVDTIINGNVMGWVVNKKVPNYIFEVELLDGGEVVTSAPAGRFRQDVAEAKQVPGYCGFELPLPQTIMDGQLHSLHVRVAGTPYELESSPLVFGPGTANMLVKELFHLRDEVNALRQRVAELTSRLPG